MHPFLLASPIAALATQSPTTLPPSRPTSPYAIAAIGDRELAAAYGTGSWSRLDAQMSDDFAANLDRQAVLVRTTITDIWSLDVAAPLIIANIVGSSR